MAAVEGRSEWIRAQAWFTAGWSRAKKMPSLEEALGRKKERTIEQSKNDLEELMRRSDVVQRG